MNYTNNMKALNDIVGTYICNIQCGKPKSPFGEVIAAFDNGIILVEELHLGGEPFGVTTMRKLDNMRSCCFVSEDVFESVLKYLRGEDDSEQVGGRDIIDDCV